MSGDTKVTRAVCATVAFIFAGMFACIVGTNAVLADKDAERERTRQAEVQACSTIDDAAIRALCINREPRR